MSIGFGHTSRLWVAGLTLVGLGALAGCLSDESDPGAETGGAGGNTAGTGGSTAGAGGSTAGTGGTAADGGTGGTAPTGTACASPIVLAASRPGIADFEAYDGSADLSTWSFALGGDSATGVFAGTFGYGDQDGAAETFAMVAGNNASTYALSISDTLSEEYGGGMGLWMSACLDASAFSGISFWVRGNSPTGTAKLSILMEETTSSTPETATSKVGTCTGLTADCIHPAYMFPVTDTWTEIQVPWSMFTAGNAAGTSVVPDGGNIWQIQFDVGLVWAANASGVYEPTPAPYEFAMDDMTFY